MLTVNSPEVVITEVRRCSVWYALDVVAPQPDNAEAATSRATRGTHECRRPGPWPRSSPFVSIELSLS